MRRLLRYYWRTLQSGDIYNSERHHNFPTGGWGQTHCSFTTQTREFLRRILPDVPDDPADVVIPLRIAGTDLHETLTLVRKSGTPPRLMISNTNRFAGGHVDRELLRQPGRSIPRLWGENGACGGPGCPDPRGLHPLKPSATAGSASDVSPADRPTLVLAVVSGPDEWSDEEVVGFLLPADEVERSRGYGLTIGDADEGTEVFVPPDAVSPWPWFTGGVARGNRSFFLNGPPGTGKTYTLAQLRQAFAQDYVFYREDLEAQQDPPLGLPVAWATVGWTTLSPSYENADFLVSIRPAIEAAGPTLRAYAGDFLSVLVKADQANDRNQAAFSLPLMFIDEFARADYMEVLGEVLTLLETTYRRGGAAEIPLRLSAVPAERSGSRRIVVTGDNVLLRADYSLPRDTILVAAMNPPPNSIGLDPALRRRVVEEDFPPRFEALKPSTDPKPGLTYEGMWLVASRASRVLAKRHGPASALGHTPLYELATDASPEHVLALWDEKIEPMIRTLCGDNPETLAAIYGSDCEPLLIVERDDFDEVVGVQRQRLLPYYSGNAAVPDGPGLVDTVWRRLAGVDAEE